MNILFRIFVFFGSLIVIALFSALIAPYFIKWEEFTSSFEREASRIVGQPVTVGGETNIRLLPLPFIQFKDLAVGKNSDGSAMLIADEFSMRAELFPFLSGELRIVEMDLSNPTLDLQVQENGTIAWTNPIAPILNPDQVNIEQLAVSGGMIKVSGLAGGRNFQLDEIDVDIVARSLNGPWRIEGDANIEGEPSRIQLQTGVYQDDGSMRLRLEVEQDERPYTMQFDGPIALKDDVLEWRGEFGFTPFADSKLAEYGVSQEPLPVEASGRFLARPESISIPEYRLEIGAQTDPYTITGNGNLAIGDTVFFRAQADGRQIDLDQIETQEVGEKSLEARILAIRNVLERIPVPPIEGEIDVILPALVAGDTYIRDVKTVFRPLGKGWDMRSFSAKFPGNTTLEASGRLGLNEDFGFDGKLLLASRQPSGFAAWISGDVDPAFRRLKSFGIASDISISQRQTKFDKMELRLDDAILKGQMVRIASSETRPAIILRLKGNRVNVQDLQAIYSLAQNPEEKDAVTHDLDIDVEAEVLEMVLSGQDVSANGVSSNIKIRDGLVSVERLKMTEFYGAEIISSGRIENLLSRPNGNMKFSVAAGNLNKLLEFSSRFTGPNILADSLLIDPILTRDAALTFELDTSADEVGSTGQVLVTGLLGGTEIDTRLGFEGLLSDADELQFTIASKLENQAPSVLMRQMGIETLAVEITGEAQGPMRLSFDVSGKNSAPLNLRASIELPDTNLAASGTLFTQDWSSFESDVSLTLGSANIAPYAVLAGINVPFLNSDSSMPMSLTASVKSTEADTQVTDIDGQVSGNEFSGTLTLEREGVSRPKLSGNMVFETINLAMLSEAAFNRGSTLVGNVVQELGLDDQAVNFNGPLYLGYDADVKLSAGDISYGDSIEGKNASLQLVMLDGSLEMRQIGMETLGGMFDGNLSLKNTQGTVLANFRYGLSGASAETIAEKIGLQDMVSGQITTQGSAEATGRSVEALIAGLSGDGLVTLKDVTVSGFNPVGFDQILLETGVDGYEIQSARIRDLVEQSILVSQISIDQVEAPYSLSRGNLRIRNVASEVGGSQLVGELQYDFSDEALEASLRASFDPGKRETIKGTEPQITVSFSGPIGDSQSMIDTDRLEGYLSLRAFEQSQRRIETLEAKVLETQRLQQQIALNFAREQYRERVFIAQDERIREETETRRQAENLKQRAEEQARLVEEQRKAAEEQAKLEAEREAAEEKARQEAERKAREAAKSQSAIQNRPNPLLEEGVINQLENFLNTN